MVNHYLVHALDPFRPTHHVDVVEEGAQLLSRKQLCLKVPICCILASEPFSLQPYYSRGENVKFYSTSQVLSGFEVTYLF